MAAHTYALGTVVRVTCAFTTGGSAVDPTTVSVIVRRPDGVKRTYVYLTDSEVVRASQGNYRLDYTTTIAGVFWYRWVSTGTGQSAGEDRFIVSPANASE